MFNFIRNLTKTEEEKRREAASAYLDDALTPKQATHFEERLKDDSALQNELKRQEWVKQSLQILPRSKAPRNYMLDPSKYGKPARQITYQLYPVLRTATVISAILFFFLVGLDLVSNGDGASAPLALAPEAEMLSSDAVGNRLQESELVESGAAELPVEESAAAVEEDFFAAAPAEAEQELAVTLEVEAEVEMEQPAAAAEAADEAALVDDEPAEEGAGSPERLPGEQSEEQPAEEIVGESISSEDSSVAPLPPSEPLTELADSTPAPAGTQTPGPTLAAKAVTQEHEEVEEAEIVEEAAPLISESELSTATSEISELPLPQLAPVDSEYPGPAGELPLELDQVEEQTAVQGDGMVKGLSIQTILEIVLGIGLLTLIAVTVILRRRVRY
jgi:hypothetical protein